MNEKLLNNLACPNCQGSLNWDNQNKQLICQKEQLYYRIENNIVVLLPESGQPLEGGLK